MGTIGSQLGPLQFGSRTGVGHQFPLPSGTPASNFEQHADRPLFLPFANNESPCFWDQSAGEETPSKQKKCMQDWTGFCKVHSVFDSDKTDGTSQPKF